MNSGNAPLHGASAGARGAMLEHHSSICLEASQKEEALYANFTWQQDRGLALEDEMGKAYRGFVPHPEDYRVREQAVETFRQFVENELPGAEVVPFGSFVMELTLPSGDVDVSVEAPTSNSYNNITKGDRVKVLTRLTKALRQAQKKGLVRGVAPVMRATVPVLRFFDVRSRVEMDVSVSNRDGVFKSRFLRLVVDIDPRYRLLAYLVKKWARHMEINDAKTGSLNTLSLYLLVAFHLQTVSPPVLPPFIDILGEAPTSGSVPELRALDDCKARVQALVQQGFGRRNNDSVAKLLTTFFHKLLLVEGMWDEGLCASTLLGRWIHKEWRGTDVTIKVEDFADVSVNTARAVRPAEKKRIYGCIQRAALTLQNAQPTAAAAILFGPQLHRRGPVPPAQQGILSHQQPPQPAQQNSHTTQPPQAMLLSPPQPIQTAVTPPFRPPMPQEILQMPGHGTILGQPPMLSLPSTTMGHAMGPIQQPAILVTPDPSSNHTNLPPYFQHQHPQHQQPILHHIQHLSLSQMPVRRPRPYQPPGVTIPLSDGRKPVTQQQAPGPLAPHLTAPTAGHVHGHYPTNSSQPTPGLQAMPEPPPGYPGNGAIAQPALNKGMYQDGAFVRLRSVPHMSERGPARPPK